MRGRCVNLTPEKQKNKWNFGIFRTKQELGQGWEGPGGEWILQRIPETPKGSCWQREELEIPTFWVCYSTFLSERNGDNNYCKHGDGGPQIPQKPWNHYRNKHGDGASQIPQNPWNYHTWVRSSSVWTQNWEVWGVCIKKFGLKILFGSRRFIPIQSGSDFFEFSSRLM